MDQNVTGGTPSAYSRHGPPVPRLIMDDSSHFWSIFRFFPNWETHTFSVSAERPHGRSADSIL